MTAIENNALRTELRTEVEADECHDNNFDAQLSILIAMRKMTNLSIKRQIAHQETECARLRTRLKEIKAA